MLGLGDIMMNKTYYYSINIIHDNSVSFSNRLKSDNVSAERSMRAGIIRYFTQDMRSMDRIPLGKAGKGRICHMRRYIIKML